MIGVTTECFIVSEGSAGSLSAPYPVHKITIVPFAQEMRRDTSLWGQLFGFQVVSGTVSNFGISFLTRKQGKNTVYCYSFRLCMIFSVVAQSAPPSPIKGGLFMTVASPGSTHHGGRTSYYPSSHAFEEKGTLLRYPLQAWLIYSSLAVPIYDGRPKNGKAFAFTDIDFQQLSDLPLYKKGRADLPPNSLVAVGYTLSTYLGNQSGMTILSSNIQFVILLGIAA